MSSALGHRLGDRKQCALQHFSEHDGRSRKINFSQGTPKARDLEEVRSSCRQHEPSTQLVCDGPKGPQDLRLSSRRIAGFEPMMRGSQELGGGIRTLVSQLTVARLATRRPPIALDSTVGGGAQSVGRWVDHPRSWGHREPTARPGPQPRSATDPSYRRWHPRAPPPYRIMVKTAAHQSSALSRVTECGVLCDRCNDRRVRCAMNEHGPQPVDSVDIPSSIGAASVGS